MTVSHRKARPAGGAYYIDGMREAALQCSAQPSTLAAEWLVSGPTENETRDALGISCGAWRTNSDVKTFRALVQGLRPEQAATDVSCGLVQNAGSAKRVALHDFTLSAPKSVSVVWAFADYKTRSQIVQAQAQAARAFVSLLGRDAAYSRQGRAGHIKSRCAVVSALFPHFTSRSGDPQLHTHCTFLNVCVRPDRTTGSLETLQVMRLLGVAACTYHRVLTESLKKIGFHIQERGPIFEIEGVPDEVCRAFSQRRAEALDAANNVLGPLKKSPLPSRSVMNKAVLMTRGRKKLFHPDELMVSWLQRGELLGFGPREVLAIRRQRDLEMLPRSTWSGSIWEPPTFSRSRPSLILSHDHDHDHSDERCNIKEARATEIAT